MFTWIAKLYHFFYSFKRTWYLDRLKKKGLRLGKKVWIVDTFFFDPSHCYLISIGDNTTICPNVRLIAHDASTKKHLGYTKFGKITIGENCFIGDSSIILPNVTIGPNTIIGAGSVVTKSIEANTVAAGNPAKAICSLDTYLKKIKHDSNDGAHVFGREFFIDNLTDTSISELLDAADEKIGFIK